MSFSRHFQIFPRRLVEQRSEGFIMPLLGKKTYYFASPPDDIQHNDEVFVIKQTNEVFKSYKYPLNPKILQLGVCLLRPFCFITDCKQMLALFFSFTFN